MTERSTRLRRMGVGVTLALTFVGLCVVVSCGDNPPGAAGDGTSNQPIPSGCATPQAGCPCDPGTEVACGQKVKGDLDFLYCYEGVRRCSAAGVYGECGEGSVVTKSLTSTIHTMDLAGSPTTCTGLITAPLLVCTNGRRQGEFCLTSLECSAGVKKCLGGPDDGASCRKEKDCGDPGTCTGFFGTCTGGTRNTFGCNALADCPGGTACAPAGGGGTCGSYTGVCDNGANDGEACGSNADCPGGACETGHGHCLGGNENDKKCRHNKHCKGNAVCSAESNADAGGGLLDPCDPYCNVYSDTPTGLDAGPGFTPSDGGIMARGCGDGLLAPSEACDDGNTTNGDGCTSGCKLETGFQCPVPGSPCIPSTCGNGVQEGLEQCDDGNQRPYDGCSPDCTREVSCPAPTGASAAPCVAVCGDGIKFPSEACDDGNLKNGDGCSSTCTIEPGATCNTVTAPNPATLDVPAIYRDFNPATHPDFQSVAPHPAGPAFPGPYATGGCLGGAALCVGGQRRGIPALDLGADKEPVFATPQNSVANATSFAKWYHDDPSVNQVILGKFIRLRNTAGGYVFDSAADPAYGQANINCGTGTCSAIGGFYPLNGLGYGNYAATGKNYHFTSEVRYPFTYTGGETLSFTGDDDVFVYIGGKKVVDLGGIHGPEAGSVTLNATTNTQPVSSPIGLVPGSTYEIAVFQAERNTTGSNYKLTLQGFNRTISQCTVPVPPQTLVRDFEAKCPVGNRPVWQLFRWKARAPLLTSIDFRAATADTLATLPAAPPPGAPATVPIGQANPVNSPLLLPLAWTYDTVPINTPVPVSQHLLVDGGGQVSKQFLRVYMTFNGNAVLYEWQQLYDCVPAE
jgi:fibro-slime domain-containing protein